MASTNSHYHFENVPRSPLDKSELQLLRRAVGDSALWIPRALIDIVDGNAVVVTSLPLGNHFFSPVTRCSLTARINASFLCSIFEKMQIPTTSRTSVRCVEEACWRFATRQAHGDATQLHLCSHAALKEMPLLPLLSFDEVLILVEKLKTVHSLWSSAVRKRQGGTGRACRALPVDELLDAIANVTSQGDDHNDGVAVNPIVQSLAEFELISPDLLAALLQRNSNIGDVEAPPSSSGQVPVTKLLRMLLSSQDDSDDETTGEPEVIRSNDSVDLLQLFAGEEPQTTPQHFSVTQHSMSLRSTSPMNETPSLHHGSGSHATLPPFRGDSPVLDISKVSTSLVAGSSYPVELFRLSDVDVPKCPRNLRCDDDEASECGEQTSRKRKGNLTSRQSMYLSASRGSSAAGQRQHGHPGGINHNFERGSTPAKKLLPPLIQPRDSPPPTQPLHDRHSPLAGMRDVSVSRHHLLQQDDYQRYRGRLRAIRVVQFR